MIANQRKQGGFLLVTVVVMLFLVATIALLLNYDSATSAHSSSAEPEAARAEYVAEAGMQHALWQVHRQQGCGPYTDITNQILGNDSYTTTLTTDLGSTSSYTVNVDQDTWIRNDQPTINNAVDSKLHIRFEFGNIERPMYRYDLSALPANATILSGTVWFYVSNEHPEGPVDIHLLTADWTETDATWDTMGASMDSAVLATIPSQPVAGVWVAVNLTAQVQAWVNGQSNYGLTLNSTSEGIHGDYASNEASQQPYLEVIVGSPPSSPATLKSVGTLAYGISKTLTRDDIVLHQYPYSSLELQPGSEGKDAEIWDQSPNNNYGDSAETWVSSASNDKTRSLLYFNMNAIPAGANIQSATLSLQRWSGSGADQPVSAHRIMNSWSEDSVTWNRRESGTNWDTAGSDFDSIAVATTPVGPGNIRYEWNIAPLVQGWVDGSYPNHGIALVAAIDGIVGHRFHTSDENNEAKRPRLTVNYSCQCGVVCVAPQGSGNIALLGESGTPPDDRDLQRKTSFESWGYTVDIFEDSKIGDIDTDLYDVVYVSETASGTQIAGQLTGFPIGVVNEEPNIYVDLDLAASHSELVGKAIDITDTSHYITALFAAGTQPIYDADMEVLTVSGAQAPGLQTLADFSGAGTLTLTDQGAQLIGGGNAVGRRVLLPLGESQDSNFNWDYLNNNGRLMVQRALQWGSGNTGGPIAIPPGLWVSTLDVSGTGAPGLDSWTAGEAVSVSDPNLALEPGTTDGTFSSMFNLDGFAGSSNTDVDAIHYVGTNITIGGGNSVDLLVGDLLLSTNNGETLTGSDSQSITVNDEDVFVFRPDVSGDYSAGRFIFLLDGASFTADQIVAISLVEKTTTIGDATIGQGNFLFGTVNRRDVQLLRVDDAGLGTTVASDTEIIDGPSLSFGSEIRGVDLAEDAIDLGGQIIPAGSILLTLANDDTGGVGDNLMPANSEDIFYLTVTSIGEDPVADATLLFEGNDVNLNGSAEHLQALTLVKPPLAPVPKPIKVYWTDDDGELIQRSDGDGSNVETVVSGEYKVRGLDIDTVNGKIYWSSDDLIRRADLDGGNIETLVTTSGEPNVDIKLDVAAGKMYWTQDNNNNEVRRANLDGSGIEVFNTSLINPMYITLDTAAGHIYLTDQGNGNVARMNLDGSGTTTLVTGIDSAMGNAVDFVNGKIYWSSSSTGDWIKRANLDGSNEETVITGLNTPQDIVYDADNDRIFWTDALVVPAIKRANGDGSNVQTIVTAGITRPRGIEIVDASLVPCAEPTPLLLVVSDAINPSSQEMAREALIESWCYKVTRIDDDDGGGDYDDAVAANDVVYISQEIASQSPGNRLDDAAIGIVNEEYLIGDDLGLAAGTGSGFYSDMNLLDNTHYITSGFDTGALALFDPANDIYTGAGFTLAPDLQVLGDAGSLSVLVVLDSGGELYGGGKAAGRRVQVAWGDDFSALNTDGQTLMRRAIEWAAGAGGGGGGGGDGCDGTYRDDFNEQLYNLNTGTLTWATTWEETGETTDPDVGDIRISNDVSNYQLQVRDDGQTVMREADLSQAGSATLSFEYRRENLNGSSDYVAVDVSYNGGSDWSELDRFTGSTDDSSYTNYNRVLDAGSLSANTRIRFRTPSSGMGNSNMVWFDNVQIQCSP